MSIQNRKAYFDYIQVFRGIAALMVVFHHSYASFAYYHGVNIAIMKYLAIIGKYGVDFFFVLSGFIITYSSYKYSGKLNDIKNYLSNRMTRVYLPYWPIGILMLILYWKLAAYSNGNRSISWVTSFLLIPDGPPALSVAWTLVHEMLFYLIFIIFLLSKKLWNVFAIIWSFAICYLLFNEIKVHSAFLSTLLSPYNLEFILGYILAYLLKENYRIKYIYTVFFSAICFTIFFYCTYNGILLFPFAHNFILSISIVFLLNAAVCFWTTKLSDRNIFMVLGNATYSIYLVHNPIQSLIVRILPSPSNNFLILIEVILVLIVCCIVGIIYYQTVEKRLIGLVKNRLKL